MELSGTTTLGDLYVKNVTLAVSCARCCHEGAMYPVTLKVWMNILGSDYTIAQFSERLFCLKLQDFAGYVRLDAVTR